MIQIQDIFENGKSDIVLKTVKGFKSSFYNFYFRKKSFKLVILLLVILIKMLVLVFIIDFYS